MGAIIGFDPGEKEDAPLYRTLARDHGVDWLISDAPVAYPSAIAAMERRVEAIRRAKTGEAVWLLEHPPVYTAGTSARPEELLDAGGIPVYHAGRGGRFTYHGPGQRVAYVMLDLRRRGADVRAYVRGLESWIIQALRRFGVEGERRCDRIGIWVRLEGGGEAKIAALGIRIRHWVTYHGIAINVAPELGRFAGIVPCGITGHGVTSLAALGIEVCLEDVDDALRASFADAAAALPFGR